MADKRNFSRRFLQEKLFRDLSPPAQQLYMLLTYEADNAGFVENPAYLAKKTGYTDKDLAELTEKGFLLPVDPDVVLIAHWFQNNHVRQERRGRTVFAEMLQLVTLEEDVYRLNTPPPVPKKKQAESSEAKQPKRFEKPSLEEVRAFIREKNFSVDADAWYSHYESNGWMVGKNKMKDWRASVNYWQHNKTIKKGREKTNGECNQNALFPYQPQWYGGDTVSSFGDGTFGTV